MIIKKVPGNSDLLINLQCEFFNNYCEKIQLGKNKLSIVEIDIFGNKKKLTSLYVSLLAWYEVEQLCKLNKSIDKIDFSLAHPNLKVRCGFVMYFKEPIYYKEGFRYIPSFPRYAIDIKTNIIDTLIGKIVIDRRMQNDYEHVYIYSPDKNANRDTRIHRLLALAWLPNNDFVNKPVVNHIDGNRKNNELQNLEWCSNEHNTNHAFDMGLNNCSLKMKTRDRLTGEVVIYRSAAEMARVLGILTASPGSLINRLPGYLYNKRYEIKTLEDKTPWYYETLTNDDFSSKSIFTITVLNKITGETNTFSSLKVFRDKFMLRGNESTRWSIDSLMGLFKEKYKDLEAKYVRNSVFGPYVVINLKGDEKSIFSSIADSAKHIGRSRTELQYDLSRNFRFIYSDQWIVTSVNKEFILEDYVKKFERYSKVLMTTIKTGEVFIADSIKHAAKRCGFQHRTIKTGLLTGKPIKGIVFRPLVQ